VTLCCCCGLAVNALAHLSVAACVLLTRTVCLCCLQEVEAVVIECWPLSELEWGALLKALWWHGLCNKLSTYYSTVGQVANVGMKLKAAALGASLTDAFSEANDPRIVHANITKIINNTVSRHHLVGVERMHQVREHRRSMEGGRGGGGGVLDACTSQTFAADAVRACLCAQMFPAEVRDGLEALDRSIALDVQAGAYAAIQAVGGRRHPTLEGMMWSDVVFVKTAACLEDGTLTHVMAVAMR
jgi:hypothetical protein